MQSRRRNCIGGVAAICLLATPLASAAQDSGIEGWIQGCELQTRPGTTTQNCIARGYIPDVKLTFTSGDGAVRRIVTTDDDGRYRIALLPGTYDIDLEHPEFHRPAGTIEGIGVQPGTYREVNISLFAKSEHEGEEAHAEADSGLPRIPGRDAQLSDRLLDRTRNPSLDRNSTEPEEEIPSASDQRTKRGQIALVQEGRNTGALAYLSYEDAFRGDYGNAYVRQQMAAWRREGKKIRQIAEVPGQHGAVVIADRNDSFVHPRRGGLVQIAQELSIIQQADLPIDLIALPPSAATAGHFLAVLGREATHRGVPDAARVVEGLLQQGRTIDVVAFPPSGGWIVVSGDQVRSGGLSRDAHVLSVLRNQIGRDRRIEDISFDPSTFGKSGERGGFAVLSNRGVFALDVGCTSLKNASRWSYEQGGRSILCNTSTSAAEPERSERTITARSKDGLIRMKRIYIRDSQEATGDELYLLNFSFRARLGTGNQQAGFRSSGGWKGNLETANNWAKNGITRDIPRAVGRHAFPSVQPFEVFGIVSLLLEEDPVSLPRAVNDARLASMMREFIQKVESTIHNRLEAEFEGPASDLDGLTESRAQEITEKTLDAFAAFLHRLPGELQAMYENHMKGGIGQNRDDFADVDVIAYINAPGLSDRAIMSDYVEKYGGRAQARRNGLALVRPGNFNRWRYCCLSEGFKVTDLNFGVFAEAVTPQQEYNYRITGELQLH